MPRPNVELKKRSHWRRWMISSVIGSICVGTNTVLTQIPLYLSARCILWFCRHFWHAPTLLMKNHWMGAAWVPPYPTDDNNNNSKKTQRQCGTVLCSRSHIQSHGMLCFACITRHTRHILGSVFVSHSSFTVA